VRRGVVALPVLFGLAALLGVVVLVLTGKAPVGRYFTLGEWTRTSTDLPNIPNPLQLVNIVLFTAVVLDPIRRHTGKPVVITSGFRSKAVNDATDGSADDSYHMRGQAADFYVSGSGFSSRDLADLIDELGIPYDELGVYEGSTSGRVHVSYAWGSNKRERYTKAGA
jgi:zinc D-Ala-D-Ala carboxypeptidase